MDEYNLSVRPDNWEELLFEIPEKEVADRTVIDAFSVIEVRGDEEEYYFQPWSFVKQAWKLGAEYRYIAIDHDGVTYAYDKRPKVEEGKLSWVVGTGSKFRTLNLNPNFPAEIDNWKDLCFEIPPKEEEVEMTDTEKITVTRASALGYILWPNGIAEDSCETDYPVQVTGYRGHGSRGAIEIVQGDASINVPREFIPKLRKILKRIVREWEGDETP